MHEECSHSNPKGLKLTLDNTAKNEAQRFEFPWMVRIMAKRCANCMCESIGGGALVSTNVVLTTAHWVTKFDESSIVVRAGEWDTDTEQEFLPHVDIGVDRKIIHHDFDNITGTSNAALLILKAPFERAPHIGTICLPREDTDFGGAHCFTMGWGKKSEDSSIYPNILKKIELPYMSNQHCQSLLRRTKLGLLYDLHPTLLCAGGEEGKDACMGDGGSPLVCPLKGYPNRYQLVGMVNFGFGCGIKDVPGVYTNVQMLLEWIEKNLKRNYVNNNDYTY